MRIAVIGSGIGGLSAAWLLSRRHQFGRAVRAGIIDHPQFRHTGRLGTQSPQAALQHCLAVIRYNNRCRAFHL